MNLDESVTDWIKNLQQGDSLAASKLWRRYFERLVRLAENRLPIGIARDFDAEDVALSAFHALLLGVRESRFPELNDRNNLWSLLVVITARKAMNRLRDGAAQKRGGGDVKGESAFGNSEDGPAIQQIIGTEPTPEFAAEFAEQCERLLSVLPNDKVRDVARRKLQGKTNSEIAGELQCGERTVERRMAVIRAVWSAYADDVLEV